ncbi:hypothetical protein [Teredinibacter franksiae]|uniref:hypothetical protein n=1 Tax=Teredinibacter franksiae TaxID=2761453 RepID=UPI001628EE49|nr:hypothetical protein [Teredinibacter franksiae]
MAKVKKKLTTAQKKVKAERQKKYMWVFMNGKQVRVKRPEMIDGIPKDEWIEQNASPIWLHQNEMWDVLDARESLEQNESEEIDG